MIHAPIHPGLRLAAELYARGQLSSEEYARRVTLYAHKVPRPGVGSVILGAGWGFGFFLGVLVTLLIRRAC